jgi:hypothetical protein
MFSAKIDIKINRKENINIHKLNEELSHIETVRLMFI